MKARVARIDRLSTDIVTLWLEPETPFHYVAGQFVDLHLPHESPDDRGTRRWFTLSSSPTEPQLAITTRLPAHAQVSSFKQALAARKPRDAVLLSEPMGDFVLPLDQSIPLTFVAYGIGSTPLRSMARWLLDSGDQRRPHIITAARTPHDFVWHDLFQTLDPDLLELVTDAPTSKAAPGNHSPLTAAFVQKHALPDSYIYLSGPEQIVERLTKDLVAAGTPAYRIISDYFPGYAA